MSATCELPEAFIQRFGAGTIYNDLNPPSLGSDDEISWALLNYICNQSRSAMAQFGAKSVRVLPVLLPKFEPRAFVYWSRDMPHDYVISLNSGTAEVLRKELIEAEVLSLLPKDSRALRSLHVDDLINFAITSVLATILHHESAHIVKFHFPFLLECKCADPNTFARFQALCEIDADKLASQLISIQLLDFAKGVADACGLPNCVDSVLNEVYVLYAVALHIWFSVFNRMPMPKASIYPHPLIRAARIAVGAADNDPSASNDLALTFSRGMYVLKGLANADEKISRSRSFEQRPFDLFDEMTLLNKKFEPLFAELDPKLVDVRRRWLLQEKG